VLGQQTETGSGLWYGLVDSWPAQLCAFDPQNQARGSDVAVQLSAVSPAPEETEAVLSDTGRTPGVPLHFSADCGIYDYLRSFESSISGVCNYYLHIELLYQTYAAPVLAAVLPSTPPLSFSFSQ